MIDRVFVDSDVILDIALAREPFLATSRLVLALIENGRVLGNISSNSITNIYYILKKSGGDARAREFITSMLRSMTVLSVDQSTILAALGTDFSDFEDAVQYCTAIENQCSCIITRNIQDYKGSRIDVFLPIEFLNHFE